MEEMAFVLRVLLGTIFLSTAVSKWRERDAHAVIVKEYRIVPHAFVAPFVRAELFAELVCGALLWLGVWQAGSAVLAALLLVMYSSAIGINLLRGRGEISCGCGGAMGNHRLSWWLVLRNGVLAVAALTVEMVQPELGSLSAWIDGAAGPLYGVKFWTLLLSSYAMLGLALAAADLQALKKRIKFQFQEE